VDWSEMGKPLVNTISESKDSIKQIEVIPLE